MFAHIIVSGFVQGVGYRQFTKKTASKIGLKGWAKNVPGGRVAIGVTGPKEKIEKLIVSLRKGPFVSEIKNIEVEWEEKDPDFKDFEILV